MSLAAQQPPATELVAEVERRLEEIETLSDPAAREPATAVVRALLELYGAGLERIVEEIAATDDGTLATALADDELISHLLLLHGLHPVPLQIRIGRALEEVRPYLESHGGDIELLSVQEPEVRLRLQGSCSGCPSSSMTLKLAVENAIRKAAPEISSVVAEDAEPAGAGASLLQIEVMPGAAPTATTDGGWTMAGGLPDLREGASLIKTVGGQTVMFLSVAGRLLGYRPRCPGCDGPLGDGPVLGTDLLCPECGNRYDVLRAGRCLDSPSLQLEPVPLLQGEDGLVKIALGAPV